MCFSRGIGEVGDNHETGIAASRRRYYCLKGMEVAFMQLKLVIFQATRQCVAFKTRHLGGHFAIMLTGCEETHLGQSSISLQETLNIVKYHHSLIHICDWLISLQTLENRVSLELPWMSSASLGQPSPTAGLELDAKTCFCYRL